MISQSLGVSSTMVDKSISMVSFILEDVETQ